MEQGNGTTAAHLRDLPVFLRAPRAAGLWLVGVLIPVATAAGFVLSYRGLFDWARYHGWPWYLAPLFPLLIDLLIIAGEVVLFVAAIDGKTPRRVRAAAWVIVVAFTALSVIGNVGHAATSDVLTRGGWGLPPVVLAVALGFGLGELKRQAAKYRQNVAGERSLPGVSSRSPATPPGTVPSDAEHAAQLALAASAAAGNPLSQRQLMTRFGITRTAERTVRQRVLPDPPAGVVPLARAGASGQGAGPPPDGVLAASNGHGGAGG